MIRYARGVIPVLGWLLSIGSCAHADEHPMKGQAAPPFDVQSLSGDQVPIEPNLIIDRQGRIQFYTLLDSDNFDAKLVQLEAELDSMSSEE